MLQQIKIWARTLKRDVHAIYLAARSPRVPWHVKIIAIAVAGYALSPIDLIPDFIPVLGYLDDLMAECRAVADKAEMRPRSHAAAIIIVAIWILGTATLAWIGFAYWSRSIQARQ